MIEHGYQAILKSELRRRCDRNATYSLRAYARALKVSPATLSQILSGKRVPSRKIAERLIESLALSPAQSDGFLASLADTHRGRKVKRRSRYFKSFIPKTQTFEIALDAFEQMSSWHHSAILVLTEVEGFRRDPQWIAAQLGISVVQAKLALERLLRLGLLEEIGGKLKFKPAYATTASKHVTTPALKRLQQEILRKAGESIDNDSIDERSHTSMVLAIDPKDLVEAKKMIEEFTQRLTTRLESGRKLRVYQLGISLFPIQTRRK